MKTQLNKLTPYIHSIFEYLHTHPEVSWKETETSLFIEARLKEEEILCKPFPHHPGLIAEIGSGKPVIAVRADMDALWQESNGTYKAIHSCGHDAHMAIVIGTAIILKNRQIPQGTVRLIFQPAEETGEGALEITKQGYVDDVDYLYGLHLRPIEELPSGQAAPAISHGASYHVSGKIMGEDAHGARPHLGTSAIEVGVIMHHLLKQIKLSPMHPYSIKMTRFEAGNEILNIIPGTALFGIDARAQTNEDLESIKGQIQKVFLQLQTIFPIEIDQDSYPDTPASIISKEAAHFVADAIVETLGRKALSSTVVTPGSDDFHFYTKLRPSIKASMLALGADLTPGLHHPDMTFDHSCLMTGIEIMTRTILNTLKAESH